MCDTRCEQADLNIISSSRLTMDEKEREDPRRETGDDNDDDDASSASSDAPRREAGDDDDDHASSPSSDAASEPQQRSSAVVKVTPVLARDDTDQQEVLAAGLPVLQRHAERPGAVHVPGREEENHHTRQQDVSLNNPQNTTPLVEANVVDSLEERERNAELDRLRQELAEERGRTVVVAQSVRRELRESTVVQCSRRRLWVVVMLVIVVIALGIGLGVALFPGDGEVIVCFVSKEELTNAVDAYLEAEFIEKTNSSSDTALLEPPFDRPIGEWCFSGINDFGEVFSADRNALNQFFNADIADWNVSGATNMSHTFKGAAKFDQPVGKWDVSLVVTMEKMFNDASSFNQDIARWNISAVRSIASMVSFL